MRKSLPRLRNAERKRLKSAWSPLLPAAAPLSRSPSFPSWLAPVRLQPPRRTAWSVSRSVGRPAASPHHPPSDELDLDYFLLNSALRQAAARTRKSRPKSKIRPVKSRALKLSLGFIQTRRLSNRAKHPKNLLKLSAERLLLPLLTLVLPPLLLLLPPLTLLPSLMLLLRVLLRLCCDIGPE